MCFKPVRVTVGVRYGWNLKKGKGITVVCSSLLLNYRRNGINTSDKGDLMSSSNKYMGKNKTYIYNLDTFLIY